MSLDSACSLAFWFGSIPTTLQPFFFNPDKKKPVPEPTSTTLPGFKKNLQMCLNLKKSIIFLDIK